MAARSDESLQGSSLETPQIDCERLAHFKKVPSIGSIATSDCASDEEPSSSTLNSCWPSESPSSAFQEVEEAESEARFGRSSSATVPRTSDPPFGRWQQRRNSDSELSKTSGSLMETIGRFSNQLPTIGILVHGCHLRADAWEHIVWGKPPKEMGRLPLAVLLAWQRQANIVIFGTGASEIDALKESEYTLKYLWDHWSDLSDFEALQNLPLGQALKFMRQVSVLDTETQNTDQEVEAALRVFQAANCDQAVLVSSPTHLPRCLACACKVVELNPEIFSGKVYASPSDTCYDQASARDVIVVEPPHRGDRDKSLDDLKFHEIVRRCYKVPHEDKRWFLERVEELLQRCNV